MAAMPSSVRIREVGPRDGFQNEPETIPTAEKVRLIDMLSASGLPRIEVTSFVRPDVIPQLADAEEVLTAVRAARRGRLLGADPQRARPRAGAGACATASTRSTSSSPPRRPTTARNVNRSIEESLAGLERTIATAREAGLRCEGVISTSFGCPYEGEVPPERVFEIAERLAAAGCAEVGFGDTTGMANPRQVREFFAAARERLGGVELTAHFHNTRGQGLANVLAALEEGVDSFESSFGELGGCPVPPGSTGNVSTEDVVSMLHEMGVETGIDLPAADRRLARRPGGARPPARRPRVARRAGGLAPPARPNRLRP